MWYWMSYQLTAYTKDPKTNETIAKDVSGLAWAKGDGRVFNWHPVLMVFGMIFCNTEAILAYRGLPFSHDTNKVIHLTFQSLGTISLSVGLRAVFRFHNEHAITNLYSLHSWVGIFTVALYALQYLVGFTTFFFPGAPHKLREDAVPVHRLLGRLIFYFSALTAALGILEKLSFNASCNVTGLLNGKTVKGYMSPDCVMGNSIGILLCLLVVSTSFALAVWPAKSTVSVNERVPLLS